MKTSFNEIMASVAGLDVPPEKLAPRTSRQTGPDQPDSRRNIADSARLSVQGAKALAGKVARDKPDPPALFDEARSDLQGNRVMISGTGQSLAKTQSGDVAWETKL